MGRVAQERRRMERQSIQRISKASGQSESVKREASLRVPEERKQSALATSQRGTVEEGTEWGEDGRKKKEGEEERRKKERERVKKKEKERKAK